MLPVAVTLLAVSIVPTGANAVGEVGIPENRTTTAPHPTPKVKVRKDRQGVLAQGWAKTSGRFPGKQTPPPTRKPAGSKSSDKPRQLTRVSQRGDFRLNLGICGRMGSDGTIPGPTRCQPFTPDQPDPERPGGVVRALPRPEDVTWEQILAEYKDVLFPGLGVKVQPKGRTLVNLDTVVYTDQSKVSVNTVTLLGFPVVVEATPMSYTWNFGDGKTLTTTSPGKAYPAKEIVHRYMKSGDVRVTLTTNYAARYNVAGTGWQYVDGTVAISGPATPLLVREAVPVLVDPQR